MKIYNETTPFQIDNLDLKKADSLDVFDLLIPFKFNEKMIEDLGDLIYNTGRQNGYCMTDHKFAKFTLSIDFESETPTYQLGITAYPLLLTKKEQKEHIERFGDDGYCWTSFFRDTEEFYSDPNWEENGACEFYNIEFDGSELIELQANVLQYLAIL